MTRFKKSASRAQELSGRLRAEVHCAEASGRGRVHPFDDLEQRTRGGAGQTPLDASAHRADLCGEDRDGDSLARFGAETDLLLKRGAELTPRAAVALGKAEWLR
jgi:hypothetical protein